MPKRFFLFLSVLMLTFFLASTGCDSGGDTEIPDNVLETAAQMFEFVSMVMDTADEGDFSDITGVGLDVDETGSWESLPYTVEITGSNFTPPETSALIKTFIFRMTIDDDPWSFEIYWEATAENWIASSVLIDAYAVWETSTPDENPPDQVTGTITVDGKKYNLEDVIEELDAYEGGEKR